MRRAFSALLLAAVAAATLSATASAKEGGVELSSTPFGTAPGEPWDGTLTVYTAEGSTATYHPSITIRNLDTGETQTFLAQPAKTPATPNPQSFRFEVVFPTEGRYRYTASDGVTDREYAYPIVQIVDPAPTSELASPSASESVFPLWPLVGALGGAATLALAGFLVIRKRRFAH